MGELGGIHHVTAIAGDAQENLDFYTGVLGMRLVKRSVNQDDPTTYHLFYADAEGNPGSDLTFFPWSRLAPKRAGTGLATEVQLAVPGGSLGWWSERLAGSGIAPGDPQSRFGQRALPFTDPHGLEVALVETDEPREFAPWSGSPVPEARQVRGLHAVRLLESDLPTTSTFLTEVLGFEPLAAEDGWQRFGVAGGGSGRHVDVREVADAPRGAWGIGGVHHVAWRVADEAQQLAVRARVAAAYRRPTEVIDRFWFKSVYFLEPGGVLFELATDGPGFAVDEELDALGERLILPPWLEPARREIEAALPELHGPAAAQPSDPSR
jgi:glyoxalase family protein